MLVAYAVLLIKINLKKWQEEESKTKAIYNIYNIFQARHPKPCEL